MIQDDLVFLIENQRKFFKMSKTRTAMFLVMIIVSCTLIFSISDAYPTSEPESVSQPEEILGNNSKLVITHVVKTIEFEVGIMDDDNVTDENSSDTNTSEFYETDIQLLNVDLLKQVVNQASEEEKENSFSRQSEEEKALTDGIRQTQNETDYKIEKLIS